MYTVSQHLPWDGRAARTLHARLEAYNGNEYRGRALIVERYAKHVDMSRETLGAQLLGGAHIPLV